jgi:hypothetical protein
VGDQPGAAAADLLLVDDSQDPFSSDVAQFMWSKAPNSGVIPVASIWGGGS